MGKKLIANLQAFASEQTVTDIRSISSQAHQNNAAEVVRDAGGKLVKVIVNLPDKVTNAGLKNARNKILQNRGVATCVILPVEGSAETFESYTEGQVLYDAVSPSVEIVISEVNCTLAVADAVAAVQATISATGGITGKSLHYKSNDANSCRKQLWVSAAGNSFTAINSMEATFKFKPVPDVSGNPTCLLLMPFSNATLGLQGSTGINDNFWVVLDPGQNLTNTGILFTDVATIYYSIDILGDAVMKINGTEVYSGNLGISPANMASGALEFASSNNFKGVFDDMLIKILDGTV